MDYIHFRNALAVLLFLSSKKKDREKGKELNCFPSIFPTWANSYELTVGVQQIPVEIELHIYFGQSDFPPTCLNSSVFYSICSFRFVRLDVSCFFPSISQFVLSKSLFSGCSGFLLDSGASCVQFSVGFGFGFLSDFRHPYRAEIKVLRNFQWWTRSRKKKHK